MKLPFDTALDVLRTHWLFADAEILAAIQVAESEWSAHFDNQDTIADLYYSLADTKMDWPRFISLPPNSSSNPGIAAHWALDRLCFALKQAGKPAFYQQGGVNERGRIEMIADRLKDAGE